VGFAHIPAGILENRASSAAAQVSAGLAPQSNRRSIIVEEDLKQPATKGGGGGGCCG